MNSQAIMSYLEEVILVLCATWSYKVCTVTKSKYIIAVALYINIFLIYSKLKQFVLDKMS